MTKVWIIFLKLFYTYTNGITLGSLKRVVKKVVFFKEEIIRNQIRIQREVMNKSQSFFLHYHQGSPSKTQNSEYKHKSKYPKINTPCKRKALK